MAGLEILVLPARQDNYIFLLHDADSGETAVVDPADAEPVEAALRSRGWSLDQVLNTHHHNDHVGANRELKARHGLRITGPAADRERIPAIDRAVGEGDRVAVGRYSATVMDVPGHTRGHIAYLFEEAGAAFVGDTLFSIGCGRMFEGTPPVFWRSLSRLRSMPAGTRIYCAHEYTQSNIRFARTVDPHNPALLARAEQVETLRARGEPSIPALLANELLANPFLRCDRPEIAAAVGMDLADPAAVFGALRAAKDGFRG